MKNNDQRTPFEREMASVEDQLQKTQKAFTAAKMNFHAGHVPGAYVEAFNFVDAAEKLVLIARQLPAYTGNPHASKMIERHITENVPIKLGFTFEGWFGVVISSLLPKKEKGSAEYIRGSLYLAMKNFWRGKEPVKYTDCTLVFRHVYKRNRPERQYRDHDNIELNAVVDAIALYVLFDDAPLRCEHYYCSVAGDENRTEIFVVPQSEFDAWRRDAKNSGGKGVILYENRP